MELLLTAGTALWLGILTSISPCPLATNIAAISYIGRRVERPQLVIWTGLLYTLGRILAYTALGVVLVFGLLSIPRLSFFLQKYMNQILGPVLILAGMFLLELITVRLGDGWFKTQIQERAGSWGIGGAGILGFVFALSFCPISAALFFGSLIPLAVKMQSEIVLPSLYGLGTSLPVVFFAVLLALGTKSLNRFFIGITQIELWARRITGVLFILIGIYMSLVHIFGLLT